MTLSNSKSRFLPHVGAVIGRILTAEGIDPAKAKDIGQAVMREVRCVFGGVQQYIPVGRIDRAQRAAEVHAARQAGESVEAIARRYGYTLSYIHQLIKLHSRRIAEPGKAARSAAQPKERERQNV